MKYDLNFIHSTKYGKEETKKMVKELNGTYAGEESDGDGWSDFDIQLPYESSDDLQAIIDGLTLLRKVEKTGHDVEIFSLTDKKGEIFTEENLTYPQ